jgi:hypothetical protein
VNDPYFHDPYIRVGTGGSRTGQIDFARGPEGDIRLDSEKATTENKVRDSGRAAS